MTTKLEYYEGSKYFWSIWERLDGRFEWKVSSASCRTVPLSESVRMVNHGTSLTKAEACAAASMAHVEIVQDARQRKENQDLSSAAVRKDETIV